MAQEKTGETETPAKHIIDQDIVNQQGKQIGELEDLVIKRNGKIKRAIIDTGGFLGFGEKLIGMSYKTIADQKRWKNHARFDAGPARENACIRLL